MATQFTPDIALLAARTEMRYGAGEFNKKHRIHSAKLCLETGDLKMAIFHTQVALFMHRIRRVS